MSSLLLLLLSVVAVVVAVAAAAAAAAAADFVDFLAVAAFVKGVLAPNALTPVANPPNIAPRSLQDCFKTAARPPETAPERVPLVSRMRRTRQDTPQNFGDRPQTRLIRFLPAQNYLKIALRTASADHRT